MALKCHKSRLIYANHPALDYVELCFDDSKNVYVARIVRRPALEWRMQFGVEAKELARFEHRIEDEAVRQAIRYIMEKYPVEEVLHDLIVL